NRLQASSRDPGPDDHQSLYSLDGQPLGGGRTTALVAMNATASLAADHPRRLDFVRALWDLPVPTGQYRYYDGMLQMMALLHLSGRYRIWWPPGTAPGPRAAAAQQDAPSACHETNSVSPVTA